MCVAFPYLLVNYSGPNSRGNKSKIQRLHVQRDINQFDQVFIDFSARNLKMKYECSMLMAQSEFDSEKDRIGASPHELVSGRRLMKNSFHFELNRVVIEGNRSVVAYFRSQKNWYFRMNGKLEWKSIFFHVFYYYLAYLPSSISYNGSSVTKWAFFSRQVRAHCCIWSLIQTQPTCNKIQEHPTYPILSVALNANKCNYLALKKRKLLVFTFHFDGDDDEISNGDGSYHYYVLSLV